MRRRSGSVEEKRHETVVKEKGEKKVTFDEIVIFFVNECGSEGKSKGMVFFFRKKIF